MTEKNDEKTYKITTNLLLDKTTQEEIFHAWKNFNSNCYQGQYCIYDLFYFNFMFISRDLESLKTFPKFLSRLQISYNKNIEIIGYTDSLENMSPILKTIAHIVPAGTYITLTLKEQYQGYFFKNNELLSYSSEQQLNVLQEPFLLNDRLKKQLNISEKSTLKIKI
jgi:hypothetical protein